MNKADKFKTATKKTKKLQTPKDKIKGALEMAGMLHVVSGRKSSRGS